MGENEKKKRKEKLNGCKKGFGLFGLGPRARARLITKVTTKRSPKKRISKRRCLGLEGKIRSVYFVDSIARRSKGFVLSSLKSIEAYHPPA